ncbi:hypothetical protein K2Z84_03215 [Candidatus Binatia bacterium]|nr:hypothetical protein [Candidatus Binatia bacterium]
MSAVVITLGLVLALARPPHPPLPTVPVDVAGPDRAVHRWLREQPGGGAVLELPVTNSVLDGGTLQWTGRAMLGSTLHWKPLLNGYSGHPPHSLKPIMTLAQRLPDAGALDLLCDLTGLTWIVVHLSVMPDEERRWTTPEALAVVEPVARFGSDAVYRLRRPCPPLDAARFARFVDPAAERTVAGTPLEALDAAQTRAAIEAELPAVMAPGRYAWTWLDLHNTGTTTWPGLAAASPWTVLLSSRWRDASTDRIFVEGESAPLVADVAPGASLRAQLNVLAPRQPGRYLLEIGLVQSGAGWLADLPGGSAVSRRTVDVVAPGH